MKKIMMLLLMLLPIITTLQAKKDPILDAIAESNLTKLRHLVRMSTFDEGDREFYGNFAREIVGDCTGKKRSIFNSKLDLVNTAIGALGGLAGLTYLLDSIKCYGRKPYRFPKWLTEEAVQRHSALDNSVTKNAPRNAAIGALIMLVGSYWFKRSLACPHTQSRLLKAQSVLDYINNFGKSETSSIEDGESREEAKPA